MLVGVTVWVPFAPRGVLSCLVPRGRVLADTTVSASFSFWTFDDTNNRLVTSVRYRGPKGNEVASKQINEFIIRNTGLSAILFRFWLGAVLGLTTRRFGMR